MNCNGPILSLQPGCVSHSPTAHAGLDLSQPPDSISSPVNIILATDMSSSGRSHLGLNSKVRSSSIADCKSAPNSPTLQLLTKKVN